MARLAYDPLAATAIPKTADPMTDLNRLLSRLQQTILRADAEREQRLRTSEYERNKVGVNIDYARTLLTRVEQHALGVKVHARRQEMQTDLNRKRELLDQVMDRMKDFEEMSIEDDYASSEGEDILGEIIATPSESMDSRSTDLPPTEGTRDDDDYPNDTRDMAPSPTQQHGQTNRQGKRIVETLEEVISEKPDTTMMQNLRPRGKQPASDSDKDMDTAQTTGATSSLFANKSSSAAATTEAMLDNDRMEQDELTEMILQRASELRISTQRFGQALEEDTEVLSKASEGLNKNELGLEAAARRMGALTRMTEGKGWWGRIMLYAWIYGLMVILVLLVFVLPKLRF